MMLSVIEILLLVIHIWAASLVGYLLLLTVAAFGAEPRTPIPAPAPSVRFAVLIPAHNEEKLLPGLLKSLALQTYPRHLWQIHVVADNCTDQTARVTQNGGAQAHVRVDPDHPGKGPALQWLFERVCPPGAPIDAVVIVDADSILSIGFLEIMAARVERGERAIQAFYAVRDPGVAVTSSLRYAALAVLHFLRPQGRMQIGGSAGLKGNGMVFAVDLLRAFPWSASVTEDIELHMRLILAGEQVTFAPDAIVLGEMPDTLKNSESQHMRWEQGKRDMRRRYAPDLLKEAILAAGQAQFGRAVLLLDAALEFWIPPFSILFGVSLLLALCNLFIFGIANYSSDASVMLKAGDLARLNTILCIFILIGQFIYLLAGLKLVRAPRSIYRSLLFSPIYMVWKTVQIFQTRLNRDTQKWVRTKRNEG